MVLLVFVPEALEVMIFVFVQINVGLLLGFNFQHGINCLLTL